MVRNVLRRVRDGESEQSEARDEVLGGAPGDARGEGQGTNEDLGEAARQHANEVLGDRAGEAAAGLGQNSGAGPGGGDEGKAKKTDDEKRADFSRLASRRLSRAFEALDSFKHLANTGSYAWSVEQEVKIFTELRNRVEQLAGAFAAARMPDSSGKKPAKPLSFTV